MDDVVLSGEPAERPAGATYSSPSSSSYFPSPCHVVQFQSRNPVWRLSPWHNGSSLYDSYELKAMKHQLEKAIQQAPGGGASSDRQSPIWRHHLDRIYKQNTKTQKRISGGRAAIDERNSSGDRARGLVSKIWKKIKQGLFRRKAKE